MERVGAGKLTEPKTEVLPDMLGLDCSFQRGKGSLQYAHNRHLVLVGFEGHPVLVNGRQSLVT